jgi:hypothetical protein
MTSTAMPASAGPGADRTRIAESALKRFGYSRVKPTAGARGIEPAFWVQEAGVPRRTFPVFLAGEPAAPPAPPLDQWLRSESVARSGPHRAIVVVATDHAAEEAWKQLTRSTGSPIDPELSILVIPPVPDAEGVAHWHARVANPKEVLRLATGIVVGLFRRAQTTEGSSQIDFEEILELLRLRFGLDVHRSLNVTSDEDALFILYQLAQRDSYAPGDSSANLHLLVLKPSGPAARLPWFAA